MLGYVESFTAHYPCRLCKLSREEFNYNLFAVPDKPRTKQTHVDDLALGSPSETGMKGPGIYAGLPSFHASMNVYCD